MIKTFLIVAVVTFVSSIAHADDLTNGKAKYDSLCASCHGPTGAGDGPVAVALPPEQKPAKLTEPSRKFAIDLVKFTELLKKGGAAVGLNPLMPPQAALADKDIKDLYAYTESFKKK